MISDFGFESLASFKVESTNPPILQLPLSISGEMLNLDQSAVSIEATIKHFAALQLEWVIEYDRQGGKRAIASLDLHAESGGIWTLMVLEQAGTGRHRHDAGGVYGECVITLAGELDDILDDGTPVRLARGAVMFHAPDTIHEAMTNGGWVGLCHHPCGCTPVS